MIELSISQLASVLSANVKSDAVDHFSGYGTDSRKNLSGQLFIALKGDSFDGHNFLNAAVDQGASCLLVSSTEGLSDENLKKVSVVEVPDTLVALQTLATWWRRENNFQVVGITGSNGKTTTKKMTLTLLQGLSKVHAAKGSFNNHWGVPFTILDTSKDTEVLII